jgi:hypothetical protein
MLKAIKYVLTFGLVGFELVSVSRVWVLCSMVSESTDRMTFPIWASLSYRIILSVSLDSSNGRVESGRRCGKPFIPSSSNRVERIIAHLTRRFGGNVRDHNVVTILTITG